MSNLAIKNPKTGLYELEAGPFPASNEVWDDTALEAMSSANGDLAIVVGSGNVPNIAPLISGLQTVCFADLKCGHEQVFRAKQDGVKQGYDFEGSRERYDVDTLMGTYFEDKLRREAQLFDLTRPDAPLHIIRNQRSAAAFRVSAAKLITCSAEADITSPPSVKLLPQGYKRVAWIHISNVAPYCLDIYHGTVEECQMVLGGIAEFLASINGISSATLVSFSRSTYFGGGLFEYAIDVEDYGSFNVTSLIDEPEPKKLPGLDVLT